MRPEASDAARLWDIVRWSERLRIFLEGVSWEQYQSDVEKQVAVERCIEVIGEAARHISDSFKTHHADIPWREIVHSETSSHMGILSSSINDFGALQPSRFRAWSNDFNHW